MVKLSDSGSKSKSIVEIDNEIKLIKSFVSSYNERIADLTQIRDAASGISRSMEMRADDTKKSNSKSRKVFAGDTSEAKIGSKLLIEAARINLDHALIDIKLLQIKSQAIDMYMDSKGHATWSVKTKYPQYISTITSSGSIAIYDTTGKQLAMESLQHDKSRIVAVSYDKNDNDAQLVVSGSVDGFIHISYIIPFKIPKDVAVTIKSAVARAKLMRLDGSNSCYMTAATMYKVSNAHDVYVADSNGKISHYNFNHSNNDLKFIRELIVSAGSPITSLKSAAKYVSAAVNNELHFISIVTFVDGGVVYKSSSKIVDTEYDITLKNMLVKLDNGDIDIFNIIVPTTSSYKTLEIIKDCKYVKTLPSSAPIFTSINKSIDSSNSKYDSSHSFNVGKVVKSKNHVITTAGCHLQVYDSRSKVIERMSIIGSVYATGCYHDSKGGGDMFRLYSNNHINVNGFSGVKVDASPVPIGRQTKPPNAFFGLAKPTEPLAYVAIASNEVSNACHKLFNKPLYCSSSIVLYKISGNDRASSASPLSLYLSQTNVFGESSGSLVEDLKPYGLLLLVVVLFCMKMSFKSRKTGTRRNLNGLQFKKSGDSGESAASIEATESLERITGKIINDPKMQRLMVTSRTAATDAGNDESSGYSATDITPSEEYNSNF